MERQKKPHIVAMPYPGQGHINPMMHLARRLASLGFSITFVLPQRYHSANVIQNGGASADGSITLEAIRDDMLPVRTMASVSQFVRATDEMQEPFQELLGRIVDEKKKKIACVISDMFLPWTQDVANLFQIPRVAFFPFPAATALLFLHLPQLTEAGYAPMTKQGIGEDEVIDFIPGLRRIHPTDVPFCIQKEDPEFIERMQDRMERLQDAEWTLVNTFDELEGSEVESMQTQVKNFVPVGPLLPSSYFKDHERIRAVAAPAWIEDERCVKWLDKQEPLSVLYLSFGSITNMTIEQLRRVEAGIRASGCQFLWVLRPNIAEGSTLQEFQTFLEGLIERTKEQQQQGLVVQWAPQLQVLRHRSVGAFLTHCGWNSTLESICAGVPMLGWPCFAEQNTNCKYMADVWKIGRRLEKTMEGIVSEEEIERKVRSVMEGDEGKEMRKRVRELGNAGRKTVEEGSNLAQFAKAMINPNAL